MTITEETFAALVKHFGEYKECNPSPHTLATMAIQTLGITVQADNEEEEEPR